jgi:Secretion system C-terminal sorting domain/FG-GAP-like repeat
MESIKTTFLAAVFVLLFISYVAGQSFEKKLFDAPGSEFFTRYHWADFNADGKSDILEIDFYSKATLHISDGQSFTSNELSFENLHFVEGWYALNDYDGDGDIDMLAIQGNSLVIVNYDKDNGFSIVKTGITYTDADSGKISWVDVNGDLVLDIIHNQRIFLNQNGMYAESRLKLPFLYSNFLFHDLNEDGLTDLVAGGYESEGTEVSLYLNQGEGQLNNIALTLPITNLRSKTITLIDVDNDSDIDVFALDIYARGWIFKNSIAQTGQLAFVATQIFTNISITRTIAGDINSDGLQDLVIVGSTLLTVLRNTTAAGTISFAQESFGVQLDIFHSSDIVDINGDSNLDINVKGYSYVINGSENLIFENISTPVVLTPPTPTNPSSIVEENVSLSWNAVPGLLYNIEVKRNGIIYKPSCTSPSGKLLQTSGSFLRSTGSLTLYGLPTGSYEWRVQAVDHSRRVSTFSVPNTFAINEGPSSLTLKASDLRRVKLCWSYNGNDNPSFKIFRGTSSGTAIEIAHVEAGITCYEDSTVPENQAMEYFVIAINGSVYSASSNRVVHHSTLLVKSSFGTADPNIIEARCFPADFDMDGDYDLEFIGRIGSSNNNFLLKNNGQGSFVPVGSMITVNSIAMNNLETAKVRDIDNDGDPDFIAVTGQDYSWRKVSVFINNNGTFTLGFETPTYLGIPQLSVEDMNNDGRLDLMFSHAMGNSTGNPYNYKLLYQTSNGNFEDSRIVFSDKETRDLSYFNCVDLNRDGFLDILWAAYHNNRNLEILVNAGGGGFTKRTTILPATYGMSVADYTGDGHIDVAVIGNEGLNLYIGLGDFLFKEPKVIPIEYLSGGTMFVHADLDLNGWTDLLLSDGYNSQVVYNKGNGSFKALDIGLQRDWGTSITITDFENDADLDIVKLGNNSQHQGLNYLYKNQLAEINVINEPPTSPAALSAKYELGKAIFSWSASTDDRTPSNSLTYNVRLVDSQGKVWISPETNESGTFRRRMENGNNGYSTIKTLNNLPAGVYTAHVQAIDASFSLSPWSQEVQLTITEGPKDLAVERILLNKVKLTWSASPFIETSVVVQRRIIGSDWAFLAELPAGSTSYSDANLLYNKLYEYRIFEVNQAQATASSLIASWSTNMWIMTETNIPNLTGSIDVADFTADGRMDIMLNGYMIYNGYIEDITNATYENSPDGWSKKDTPPSALSHTAQGTFTDLNGDSKPDIYKFGYISSIGYKTETFINNGDKSFSPVSNDFTEGTYDIQSYIDFDKDNDLDITAIKAGSYPTVREVFENKGGGIYNSVETMTCYFCPQDMAVADFDKDGDEDVIRSIGGTYQLYQNTPEGFVATNTSFSSYDNRIAITDYNGDGFSDIVLMTSSFYYSGKIFKNLGIQNDGSLKFTELPLDLSSGDQSMHSADFDHDGNTDLAVMSPNIKILLNNGGDTFQQYHEPGIRLSIHLSKVIDYDNDGDLDIYFSGYVIKDYNSDYSRKARVLINQTIVAGKGIVNEPPDPPHGMSSIQDGFGLHLSWNKPNDDHTPPNGITYDVVLSKDGKSITKGDHDPTTGQRIRLKPGRSYGKSTINNIPVGQYSWRVQAIDGSFAASAFSETGTFIFLPPPPGMNDTLIYKCGRTISLTAIGTDIKWYSDESLTQLIASGVFHPDVTQTVYVTQTVDGLRGVAKRVLITILDKPPVPTFSQSNPYSICENINNQTLWATGENVNWFSDASLTTLLSNTNQVQVPSSNATYFVTQTIGGCQSNSLAIQVQVITIDSRLYFSDNKIWSKETAANYFYWYRNGFYYQTTTEPFIPFDGEVATYSVQVIKGQCQEISQPFITSEENITAVEEMDESLFSIFPNPASSRVSIKSKLANSALSIYDSLGKLIYSLSLNSGGEKVIDTSHWIKGIYVVVMDDGKNVYTKRLVLL